MTIFGVVGEVSSSRIWWRGVDVVDVIYSFDYDCEQSFEVTEGHCEREEGGERGDGSGLYIKKPDYPELVQVLPKVEIEK
jgi:hypothetical protein